MAGHTSSLNVIIISREKEKIKIKRTYLGLETRLEPRAQTTKLYVSSFGPLLCPHPRPVVVVGSYVQSNLKFN
jgi:hypothetical protein